MKSGLLHSVTDQGYVHLPWFFVLVNTVFVLLLAIFPLPVWAVWLRPEFPLLFLFYCIITVPFQFGLLFAWFLGLCLDTFESGLLGTRALGMTLVAYVVYLFHQRLRMFTLIQQMLVVFALTLIYQLFNYWVHLGADAGYSSLQWSISAISTMVCWPLMYGFFEKMRASM